MTRTQVFEALRKQNIAKMELSFSGGNDEGSVDSYLAYFADGTQRELEPSPGYLDHGTGRHLIWEMNPVTRQTTSRATTEEEERYAQLMDALEEPVYDRYGGFAGEFHVYGKLTWDVAAQTAVITGQESHESYEDFEANV